MSREKQFHEALYGLRYNYPNSVTTWGHCCTEGCPNGARGSGKCGTCFENEMAEIIGDEVTAMNIHEAIKDQSRAIAEALELAEELDFEQSEGVG